MVMIVPVNLLAVIIASLLSVLLGTLWYSRFLFGTSTDKKSEKDLSNTLIAIIASVITAYIFAQLIIFTGSITLAQTIRLASSLWLGFVAAIVIQEGTRKKAWRHHAVHAGYHLVSLMLMAVILSSMR